MDTVLNLNDGEGGSLRATLRKSARALTQPSRFFRQDLPAMDTPSALAFGIGNAWAASALSFFVQTLNSLLVARLLDRWMQRLVSSEQGFDVWSLSGRGFLYAAGALLLGPFLFLLQAVFFGGWLYLFARLLIEDRPGAPEPVTYQGALRIQASTLVSHWFSIVPVFGGLLAFLAGLVLSVTGVRERFGVSTRRASAVVIAPYLLTAVGVLVLGALFLVALSQLPFQDLFNVDTSRLGF
jgi:hypothetical protein